MEITIQIDEMTEEELNERFDVLKGCARDKMTLPEDFEADIVDLAYFEAIRKVYINYRLQIASKEDLQALGARYRKKYGKDKALYIWKLEAAKAVLETRKKTGQLTKQMITLDFDTYNQAENLLQKLFEVTLDSVTANELQHTFVQYLKTGCKPQEEVTTDDKLDNADGQACA